MNKIAFDSIAAKAFKEEINKMSSEGLTKKAGEISEVAGSVIGAPLSIPTGILGYLMGPKTKEEMKDQDAAGLSNILLSSFGLPGYRLGRRLATNLKEKRKEND